MMYKLLNHNQFRLYLYIYESLIKTNVSYIYKVYGVINILIS